MNSRRWSSAASSTNTRSCTATEGHRAHPVERTLAQGRDVLLEIDWQGARQVRMQTADTVSIFILPPSRSELERRLRARAADSEAVIRRRLDDSRDDIAHAVEFDYLIVNDDFATALSDLRAVVNEPPVALDGTTRTLPRAARRSAQARR